MPASTAHPAALGESDLPRRSQSIYPRLGWVPTLLVYGTYRLWASQSLHLVLKPY